MTFESVVTSANEVIDIDGYNYDSVDKATLTIGTEENVINIYYTKRTDLSYKVNYLEKGTNKVLHDQKVQEGMTFESVVTSANEVIDIDGYNYDSVDKDTLTITTGENVINIYYTKRNDLSYTVNYLEKDTNIVLHEPKVTENMTFEATINSDKEVIDRTSVEGAISIVEYFRITAKRVQDITNSSAVLEQLPTDKFMLYSALPMEFSTSEGITVAQKQNISIDSFKRFFEDNKAKL